MNAPKSQQTPKSNYDLILRHIKDNPDGSSIVEFDVTPELIQHYKLHTGRKRYSKKGLSNFILQLVTKLLDNKN